MFEIVKNLNKAFNEIGDDFNAEVSDYGIDIRDKSLPEGKVLDTCIGLEIRKDGKFEAQVRIYPGIVDWNELVRLVVIVKNEVVQAGFQIRENF